MAIKINPSHKGLLHEDLGIPKDKPIPLSRMMAAKRSKDPAERKRVTFAANAREWNK
jgi:hypothetical protein